MGIEAWTWLVVGASFALYALIALKSQARSATEFYVAKTTISPVVIGMATAADWMSAASFMSMAGVLALYGRGGSTYLMGWTGGYVLLAVLLAPHLRKYGKLTVPQFVAERYYSRAARLVALVAALVISFTYVAGQVRGAGIVLARFLDLSIEGGVAVGVVVVFLYAVLGGMKGITYTQVAQYVVLIMAFLVPAIFLSFMFTGVFVPQQGVGATLSPGGAARLGVPAGRALLEALDGIQRDLGLGAFTRGSGNVVGEVALTLTLMVGTAGLPHIIGRFFTTPRVRDARAAAAWALLFITVLYVTAPALAVFGKATLISSVNGRAYAEAPAWFKDWEKTKLVSFHDRNGDGRMTLGPGAAGGPTSPGEVTVDPDILVLAAPQIAGLPPWVVALVAAGALATALSTAAGLLLVIAAAIAHDLVKGTLAPYLAERHELTVARVAAAGAAIVAGYFGVHPPGPVAAVVALAFGFAASSFFPVILLGVFWKRATREGALAGMLSGLLFTSAYVTYFKLVNPAADTAAHWLFGISPEGSGALGMALNFVTLVGVSLVTAAPPQAVQEAVVSLRYPRRADLEAAEAGLAARRRGHGAA